jgi:Guanylate kinase.
MGKLYCLLGKSGSGKDTIFKLLMNDKSLRLSPVITYTTRPRREHETDGVEYNFITPEELMRLKAEGKIIEMRKYNTVKGVWYYCTVDDGKVNFGKRRLPHH